MGFNDGFWVVTPRRLLRLKVEKRLDGCWVTMGFFSDEDQATSAAVNGFGGMCRITEITEMEDAA